MTDDRTFHPDPNTPPARLDPESMSRPELTDSGPERARALRSIRSWVDPTREIAPFRSTDTGPKTLSSNGLSTIADNPSGQNGS